MQPDTNLPVQPLPDESGWNYYSTLVPGYVEKHGLRGVRERNSKLLKSLRKSKNPFEQEQIRESLAENNRPLAMYCAHRITFGRKKSTETIRDDYQECLLAMWTFIRKINPQNDGPAFRTWYFQASIYKMMMWRLYYLYVIKDGEDKPEFLPLDKEDFPQEELLHEANTELIGKLTRLLVSPRSEDILRLFYAGNPDKGIEGYDLEEIGDMLGLTRERVRQIKNKALDKLRSQIPRLIRNGLLQTEDLIIEYPFEKKVHKKPLIPSITRYQKEWESDDVRRSFLKYAYDQSHIRKALEKRR